MTRSPSATSRARCPPLTNSKRRSASHVERRIVPVTCGSALRGVGVDRLATLLDEIAESRPIPAVEGGVEVLLDRDPDGDPVLRAFKVIVDPYVGRIVVMEVISGTISSETTLFNTRTKSEERLHGLNHLFGSKLMPIDQAFAGDVVAVAKLNNVVVGDLLTRKGRELSAIPGLRRTPAMSVALVSSANDDDKLATALHRLAEEDPSLGVRHDPVSRQLVIDVMGDVHLQVTLERLRRRFNVEVTTAHPSVALFETIASPTDIEGRLKKQTGGHGQYAVVNLKIEPLEPTAPFEFVDAIVGGAVPRQYIGAVAMASRRPWRTAGPMGTRSSVCGSPSTTASSTASTPPRRPSRPRRRWDFVRRSRRRAPPCSSGSWWSP